MPTETSRGLRPVLIVGGLILLGVAGALGVSGALNGGGGTAPTPTIRAIVEEPTFTFSPTEEPIDLATLAPTLPPLTAPSYAKLSDRDWAKVVKTPDTYIGEGYQVWGCITQFDAATGDDSFRADAANKNLKDEWYLGENVIFSGDAGRLADFVRDDIVFMKVVSLGSQSYETTLGGSTIVPWFQVVEITTKGSCK